MSLQLPQRPGERPRTSEQIPHRQLEQTPSAPVYDVMAARFLSLPDTSTGPSLISVKGARALFLDECVQCRADAFMVGREFAHIHPLEDGSFHMILSEPDCEELLSKGWGELHPYARTGRIQRTTAMVYAPRDEEEIDIIMSIAKASLRAARQEEGEQDER